MRINPQQGHPGNPHPSTGVVARFSHEEAKQLKRELDELRDNAGVLNEVPGIVGALVARLEELGYQ